MKRRTFSALAITLLAIALLASTTGITLAGIDTREPATHLSLAAVPVAPEASAGTGFTYQGSLKDGGNPANGQYDFRFTLFDAHTGGNPVGSPVAVSGRQVTNGLFTVTLDFGANAFNGDARYLQIEVKPAGEPGYTLLSPLQPVTPAPYALFALKTQGYKNVVSVSPTGGDYATITAALNSITNASATNRYLLWVGPGTYNERVAMKPFVDIEGSGEKTTRITHVGSSGTDTGTVVGANNSELRFLTVENTGGITSAIAVFNNGASPRLLQVTVAAYGGWSGNYAFFNQSSSPILDDVTISVSGGQGARGMFNISSSPTMNNVTITASGAVTSNEGVRNEGASSPNMNDVTITATGGTDNYGVFNYGSSSPAMNNVTISANSSSRTYGVYNNSSSSPAMDNVSISAHGGTSYGIYNFNFSSPTISNSAISGGSYGIFTESAGTIAKVNNSRIAGGAHTIVSSGAGVTRVAASQLDGGPALIDFVGTLTCAGVYDENYAFYAGTCP